MSIFFLKKKNNEMFIVLRAEAATFIQRFASTWKTHSELKYDPSKVELSFASLSIANNWTAVLTQISSHRKRRNMQVSVESMSKEDRLWIQWVLCYYNRNGLVLGHARFLDNSKNRQGKVVSGGLRNQWKRLNIIGQVFHQETAYKLQR